MIDLVNIDDTPSNLVDQYSSAPYKLADFWDTCYINLKDYYN